MSRVSKRIMTQRLGKLPPLTKVINKKHTRQNDQMRNDWKDVANAVTGEICGQTVSKEREKQTRVQRKVFQAIKKWIEGDCDAAELGRRAAWALSQHRGGAAPPAPPPPAPPPQ